MPEPPYYVLLGITIGIYGIVTSQYKQLHNNRPIMIAWGLAILAQEAQLFLYHAFQTGGQFWPEDLNQQIHMAILAVIFVLSAASAVLAIHMALGLGRDP